MRFRIATRDELWIRGRLVERRLSCGEAVEEPSGRILASDEHDPALEAAADEALAALRSRVLSDARMRLVADAGDGGVTVTITVTLAAHSIVTDATHLDEDVALLRSVVAVPAESSDGHEGLPFVWRNGSAAVLLHEAVGHASEHAHGPLEWPSWLQVDVPLERRRASFRDVPLLRMKEVVASQHGAPAALPADRVDVLLVQGGAYDPLTEMVTIRVAAADVVRDGEVRRLAPFTIARTRSDVARSLVGAVGDPIRYPGVICSREGQEITVGSYAPLMVTDFR